MPNLRAHTRAVVRSRHDRLAKDPSGVNAPSLKFAVVQESAFAAQRMKNYLIRFLCKVWPAIPTKLRAHRDVSLLSRLGKNQMQKTNL